MCVAILKKVAMESCKVSWRWTTFYSWLFRICKCKSFLFETYNLNHFVVIPLNSLLMEFVTITTTLLTWNWIFLSFWFLIIVCLIQLILYLFCLPFISNFFIPNWRVVKMEIIWLFCLYLVFSLLIKCNFWLKWRD